MKIKYYTVLSQLKIPNMGGIQGPMTTPTKMEFNDVLWMVNNGYVVYEHNPVKLSEKVRVTTTNINSIKFKASRAQAVTEKSINRELQEMSKPVKAFVEEVESKDKKKEKKKEEIPEETIVKPDEFQKI